MDMIEKEQLERMVGNTGLFFQAKEGIRDYLERSGIDDEVAPCEVAQALTELAEVYQQAWDAWVEECLDDEDDEDDFDELDLHGDDV